MSGSARSPAARVQSVAVAQGSRAADRRQAVTGHLRSFDLALRRTFESRLHSGNGPSPEDHVRRVVGRSGRCGDEVGEAATGHFPAVRTPMAANVRSHCQRMRASDPLPPFNQAGPERQLRSAFRSAMCSRRATTHAGRSPNDASVCKAQNLKFPTFSPIKRQAKSG
jgi:hypothetical protein